MKRLFITAMAIGIVLCGIAGCTSTVGKPKNTYSQRSLPVEDNVLFDTDRISKRKPRSRRASIKSNKKCAPIAKFNSFRYEPNTEEYQAEQENLFCQVIRTPLSTISIDVDTASYSNMRRYIQDGNLPPVDSVRPEEFINYFTYDYPQSESRHPVNIHTELGKCPWNQKNLLARVGIKADALDLAEAPPSNFVFLIDTSGSMNRNMKLVKKGFSLLVSQLREEDRVAIVAYAGSAGLVLESTPGSKKGTIKKAIKRLQSGGSTNGGAGIHLAYDVAETYFIKGGNNRVVLITDGDFNVGTTTNEKLVDLIEDKRETGVFLSVLGVGSGNYKDAKMEQLADKGNGNYAYIDNIFEAKKVFVNEFTQSMFTMAKDVKIQIEFNPAKIKSYRLVGYENRKLADKDFKDDTKDAGEMGAGHTVTALYECVIQKDGDELPSDGLRYQNTEVVDSNEFMHIKVRYKEPDGEKSKKLVKRIKRITPKRRLSTDFQFAAAVAEFAMLISDSKYINDEITYEAIINQALKAKGEDKKGYRAEFIKLVEMAQALQDAS